MSRSLIYALDTKMQMPNRRPAYRVYLYDVRSTADTIGSIVRGLELDALTGPLDVTDHVASVDVTEVAGDFVSSGVPASKITLSLVDDTPGDAGGRWDPQFYAGDPTAPARFLRKGNVLRLLEGDVDVDEEEWPITFTGVLVGQAGIERGRAAATQGLSTITMAALDRSSKFTNQIQTSDKFARGASYLTMGQELAENLMGLDFDEIDFSGWGSQTTGLDIQFVEQSPLVGLAQVMFVDSFLPRFDGEGKLSQSWGDTTKTPARIYATLETIKHIGRPYSDANSVNSVEVIGLDAEKSLVVQQAQPLAEVSVTTGYFTSNEEIRVYWSDDRTGLAQNLKMVVQRSVNGGLSGLGGGEDWRPILAPNQTTISIGAVVELDTGFAPYIIIFLVVIYIVLAIIPDGAGLFFTISIGRLIQAIALAAILYLMTKIGRGQYVFKGEPVEWVYREIRAIAELEGLSSEERNPVTISNHLVQLQSDADSVARVVLFRQQARGNPRNVEALHDLRLEPDDIFEIPDGRRFLIESINRRLVRSATEILAKYGVYEVTPGLEP